MIKAFRSAKVPTSQFKFSSLFFVEPDRNIAISNKEKGKCQTEINVSKEKAR
jgi:hypothetical protein